MIREEIKSFGHAFRGIKFLFLSQKHFRFHVLASLVVIGAGIGFCIDTLEWAVLLLCIGSVLMAEAINSALEVSLDQLHPDRHPMIGKAKDIAAGAVLLISIASAITGVLIFWPYIF